MRHRIRYRRITAPDAVDTGDAYSQTIGLATYLVKDRARIVTLCPEEELRVWDADSGSLLTGPFQARPDACRASFRDDQARAFINFEVDGEPRLVSSLNIDSLHLWDPEDGRLIQQPILLGDATPGPRFTSLLHVDLPAGPLLAATTEHGEVHLLDARTGEPTGTCIQADDVRVVTLDTVRTRAGRTLLVVGSADGAIRVWDVMTGEAFGETVAAPAGFTAAMPFLTDDGRVAVAVADQDVECWEIGSGAPLRTLSANWNAALTVLEGIGAICVTVDSAGRATLWRLSDGEELGVVMTEAGSHLRSAFQAGRHLALNFCERIELWLPSPWRHATTVSPRRPGSASEVTNVLCLISLPDGRLVLGLEDGWGVVDFSGA